MKPIKEETKSIIKEEKPVQQQKNNKTYKFNSIKEESVVYNTEINEEDSKQPIVQEKPVIQEEVKQLTIKEEPVVQKNKKTYKFDSQKQEEQAAIEKEKNIIVEKQVEPIVKEEIKQPENKQKTFNFHGKKVNESEELGNAKVEKQKLDEEGLTKKQQEKQAEQKEKPVVQENKKTYKFNSQKQEEQVIEQEKNVIVEEQVEPTTKEEIKQPENKQKTFNFHGKKVSESEGLDKKSIKQEEINTQQENTKKYKLNSEDKKSITMEETLSKNVNKNIVVEDEEVKEVQPKMKLINEGDKVNPKLIYNLKNPDAK